MKIATHSGNFHTDEIISIAIMKILNEGKEEMEVIRSRDPEILKTADMRIDVGGKYNPKTKDFDHHQKGFEEKRENGIPYSSAGLIWKEFGMKLVNSEEAFEYIDKKIMWPIDLNDVGISYYKPELAEPYTVGQMFMKFRPILGENQDFDKGFFRCVEIAQEFLKREIKIANALRKGKDLVKKIAEKTNEEYIIIDAELVPYASSELINHPKIKFIIYKYNSEFWGAKTIVKKENSFESKLDFPKEWGGLSGEALQKITGVKTANFCHKGLFIVTAKTKEDVIRLVEMALSNKN